MAKYVVISMFDVRTGIFGPPAITPHLGEALRGWEEACNKPDSQPYKFPNDFQLWTLGDFDSCSGIFDFPELQRPKLVATALEYRKPSPQMEFPTNS